MIRPFEGEGGTAFTSTMTFRPGDIINLSNHEVRALLVREGFVTEIDPPVESELTDADKVIELRKLLDKKDEEIANAKAEISRLKCVNVALERRFKALPGTWQERLIKETPFA